jgi:lipopolysaccharide/colanic/teichoic acid biosynthesis glycosyltransferase
MHTAKASSKESIIDLPAPNIRAFRDPGSQIGPHGPSQQVAESIRLYEGSSIGPFQELATLLGGSRSMARTEEIQTEVPTWKRILDISCIVLALPLWLPIFLAIALWVKLVSPGPIFFRQERIGLFGKRFMILKFRTMKVNVETGSHERHLEQLINSNVPMTKLDITGDPRIIAGGRILRAIGLDELPQLLNVLRGDMSLVGPRPCTPHEFKSYKRSQVERVNALPGLTGYWQVNGKNKTTFSEMIDMDIFYAKNLSFWLDLEIIARTLPTIIVQVIESRISACRRSKAAAGGAPSATGSETGTMPASDLVRE